MFYAAGAKHPLLGELEAQFGHHGEIPDERTTRVALDGFFKYVATLYFVASEEHAGMLVDKVYHSEKASMQDISELSGFAAVGGHYKLDEVSDSARASYFFLASTGLNESMQKDRVQGMRIFICLCLSSIHDKSLNARLLIGMSLIVDVTNNSLCIDSSKDAPGSWA